jgi:hypothetical protein
MLDNVKHLQSPFPSLKYSVLPLPQFNVLSSVSSQPPYLIVGEQTSLQYSFG